MSKQSVPEENGARRPGRPAPSRALRGVELYREQARRIRPMENGFWSAPSCSGRKPYAVDLASESCTCPDWREHRKPCKHVFAARAAFMALFAACWAKKHARRGGTSSLSSNASAPRWSSWAKRGQRPVSRRRSDSLIQHLALAQRGTSTVPTRLPRRSISSRSVTIRLSGRPAQSWFPEPTVLVHLRKIVLYPRKLLVYHPRASPALSSSDKPGVGRYMGPRLVTGCKMSSCR